MRWDAITTPAVPRPAPAIATDTEPAGVKSAEGAIDYSAPQIGDLSEPFRSRIRAVMRGRTEELEALAVEMYARGLSTRDIEALFADKNGASLLSRTIEECLPRSLRQRCLAHKMSTACYKAPSAALARLLRDDIAAT